MTNLIQYSSDITMLSFLSSTQSKAGLLIVDYAALSTNPNDVKQLIR
jgi:hypothetical protein